MYSEKETFENIMARVLSRLPNDIDKREGSIIWDALAPCCLEIESIYYALDEIIKQTMAVTSSREFLEMRALERGLEPYPSTRAIIKLQSTSEISNGKRLKTLDGVEYTVTDCIDESRLIYLAQCEKYGDIGNIPNGKLIQIDYVPNFNGATILSVYSLGKEEEDTEKFRTRYLNSFKDLSYGGNISDYTQKTLQIDVVGAVKVTPIWNGGGTVKLTILDTKFNKADKVTIKKVQDIIDPKQDAKGLGVAPIGHIVTVDTVSEVSINIKFKATFLTPSRFKDNVDMFKKTINKYFHELKQKWDKETIVLRPTYISSRLLALDNIEDIRDVTINGTTNNVKLGDYEIPIIGDVSESGV